MKVLHLAAECFPLAKTGGLGDVLGALPPAQRRIGIDARVGLPGYRGLAARLESRRRVASYEAHGHRVEVLEGVLPGGAGRQLPVYLFECPALYDRDGVPYRDGAGREFEDNALRFGCFAEVAARFASQQEVFAPDLVHMHDWQAGPAAAWLGMAERRPATLLSIHNLAYQGVFPQAVFQQLAWPAQWWSPQYMEFWGRLSFLKAGIRCSDAVATVSPRYAAEILTPEFGCGLEGDLGARGAPIGIVNGIDTELWDPRSDPLLVAHYSTEDVELGKAANKSALCSALGLAVGKAPLVAFVGRLAQQKGADLILQAAPRLLELPAQYVVLASGDADLERAFRQFAATAPAQRVQVRIVHDEGLAHQLTAAADLMLMPSRFEPCGLSQMYAQRYGALPVVCRTGGLADTVVDATPETLAAGTATGVQFLNADADGLLYGVRRGLELLADPVIRGQLRQAGMRRDFSWTTSARDYEQLYLRLMALRPRQAGADARLPAAGR